MGVRKIMVWVLIIISCACSQNKTTSTFPSLPDYDLTNPVMIHLRTDLDEISGIVYYPKDSSIFAINDEMGILYKIYLRKKIEVKKWKFSPEGDYEDIALFDSTFYVLQSSGDIKGFKFPSKDSLSIVECTIPLYGNNDFETLYLDNYYQKLVLICKDCESDGKNKATAYSFNPSDDTYSDNEFFKLNIDSIEKMLELKKLKFRPSAAAVHPITKDVYIISSTAKAIAITDRDGKIKNAYLLDPRLFKQPEGLTFTPSGDMLISNESAEIGAANILIFKYKPGLHEKG